MLEKNRKGIFLVISAMTILSVQDVLIKLVSDELSLFQIQFFRSMIGIALIIAYQKIIHEPIRLTTAYPLLTGCRGLMFFSVIRLSILPNQKCLLPLWQYYFW